MPRILQDGNVLKEKYRIIKQIANGDAAVCFESEADGKSYFIKQYKHPMPGAVEWYQGFKEHQGHVSKQISNGPARNFCLSAHDLFEERFGPLTLFQVFDFVDGGLDLKTITEQIKNVPWTRRVLFAKVVAFSVSQLHKGGIIHADLKPQNIILCKDGGTELACKPRLIDTDFSLIEGKKAPWDNHVGTPYYMSPEHVRKEDPSKASDVFTLGLILWELLAGRHPYTALAPKEYERVIIEENRAGNIELAGKMPDPADAQEIVDVLAKSLDPDPDRRPTSKEVHAALLGRDPRRRTIRKTPPSAKAPRPAATLSPATPRRTEIVLTDPARREVFKAKIGTPVGKILLESSSKEYKHYAELQFTLAPRADGVWTILPCQDATFETHLNGKSISIETPLKTGDVIGIGRESMMVFRCPLTVSFGE
ncbi:hypothetical protein BH09SUM1_BH09SUM1_09670 [soil metagenome]